MEELAIYSRWFSTLFASIFGSVEWCVMMGTHKQNSPMGHKVSANNVVECHPLNYWLNISLYSDKLSFFICLSMAENEVFFVCRERTICFCALIFFLFLQFTDFICYFRIHECMRTVQILRRHMKMCAHAAHISYIICNIRISKIKRKKKRPQHFSSRTMCERMANFVVATIHKFPRHGLIL